MININYSCMFVMSLISSLSSVCCLSHRESEDVYELRSSYVCPIQFACKPVKTCSSWQCRCRHNQCNIVI